MLDEYVEGTVSRISPEAPVVIVKAESTKYALGGAANVANNIAALGGRVSLLSIIGDDEDGKKLNKIMLESGIDCSLMVVDKTYRTNKKTRILGNRQQITRVDFYEDSKPSISSYKLLQDLLNEITRFDIVVLSDYGKSICTEGGMYASY